jgi:DNA-binding response OmpR family regulator
MLFGRRAGKIRRLLIVEDEPLIAFDNEHFLIDIGYIVVATTDDAAKAKAAIARGGIDLILSDVTLARGSSGLEVARAAMAADIPLLFVTATCPIDAPLLAIGCLAKPYTQRALKQAIEAVETRLQGGTPKRMPRSLTLY